MREMDRFGSALDFRESMRKFIRSEVDRIRPRYRYAKVISFDVNLNIAEVQYPGESGTVFLPVSGGMPSVNGQIVRIEGLRGDRFVAGSMGNSLSGSLHNSETLKDYGIAPDTTYEMEFKPKDQPHWPQVFAGGAIQYAGIDYTTNGKTLTVLPAMGLRTEEKLYVDYDYLFGTAIVGYPLYVSEVLRLNPIGYWRLNEEGGSQAADSSGAGRTATIISGVGYSPSHVGGDPQVGNPGRPDGTQKSAIYFDTTAGHMDFNGNNKYCYLPNVAALGSIDSFSCVFFQYHVGGAGQFETFILGDATTAWNSWTGGSGNGNFQIATVAQPTLTNLSSFPPLATFNDSYGVHIALTYNHNTGAWAIYKDAAIHNSGSITPSPLRPASGLFRFGSNAGNSSGQGLSEVALYNYALSAGDVADLYNAAVDQGYWW